MKCNLVYTYILFCIKGRRGDNVKVYSVPEIVTCDAAFGNGLNPSAGITIAAGIKSAIAAGIKAGIKGCIVVAVPGPA